MGVRALSRLAFLMRSNIRLSLRPSFFRVGTMFLDSTSWMSSVEVKSKLVMPSSSPW